MNIIVNEYNKFKAVLHNDDNKWYVNEYSKFNIFYLVIEEFNYTKLLKIAKYNNNSRIPILNDNAYKYNIAFANNYFYKKNILIYYSNTSYELLFQRPHQIMRFMKDYQKIFIGKCNNIKFEKKYNLTVIPYNKKNDIINKLDENSIIYYTDSRLFDEVSN